MKKLSILFVMAVLFSFVSQAQDEPLKSKKGTPILPQKGDIALGIDASPLIDLAGNLIKINSGGTFNDPASFNFLNGNNTLYGKYFASKNTAYRAKVRIGYHSDKFKNYVVDDSYDGDPADYDPATDDVKDSKKESYTMVMLGGGIEKRRGHGRIQGFYGAEALITIANGTASSPNEKYNYGNPFTEDTPSPTTTTDFNNGNASNVSNRMLSLKQGMRFGLGARAFAGVEYFFAPKMAVGGEFGWGFNFMTQGDTKTETERWNSADTQTETIESVNANGNEFDVDTDNFGGQIYLLFHF